MAEYAYFKPLKKQTDQLQGQVLWRFRTSHFSRWVMLLCAKICEDIVDGNRSQTALHVRWLGDIEAAVRRRLTQDPTPREAEDLRGDWLEVCGLFGTLQGPIITIGQLGFTYQDHAWPKLECLRGVA